MLRDLVNNIHTLVAIAPVVGTDNTVLKSAAIDVRGMKSVTFVILLGTLSDTNATFVTTVKEGSDSTQSNHAAVDDADLLPTTTPEVSAGFIFSDDGETRKIGYVGIKDYVSIEIAPSGNDSGNIPIAVACIMEPLERPAANPPQ